VYNNTVIHNKASGNGLAGVVIHAHYTGGEYLQGNKIVGNKIGRNNITGDNLDTPYTGADFATTGILVFSAMLCVPRIPSAALTSTVARPALWP
jgi:hypothetical protein